MFERPLHQFKRVNARGGVGGKREREKKTATALPSPLTRISVDGRPTKCNNALVWTRSKTVDDSD